MASGDRTLQIEVEFDASGAIKGIKTLDDALGGAGKAGEKAGKGFTSMQSSIVTLNQAVQLGITAFNAMRSAIGGTLDALNEAGRIEGLNAAFENLQASVGATASETLPGLQRATKGLVSDLDLLQSANQAVLLGVDRGTGEFAELAEGAVQLGRAMGIDAKQSIDSLVVGIGRQSKLVLDNLGIIVQAEKAYEDYARSIGTTSDALTDNEKKLAFNAAAAEAIRSKVAELPPVAETAATAATRLGSTFDNLRKEFLENLSANDDLRDALNELGKALGEIDVAALAKNLAEIATAATKAASAFSKLLTPAMKVWEGAVKTALQAGFALKAIYIALADETVDLADAQRLADGAWRDYQATLKSTQPILVSTNEELEGFIGSMGSIGELVPKVAKALSDTGDEAGDLNEKLEEFNKLVKEASGTQGVPELIDQFRELFDNQYVLTAEAIADGLRDIGNQAITAGTSVDAVSASMKQAAKEADKLRESVKGDTSGGGLFGDLFPETLGDFKGPIAESIFGALQGASESILSGDFDAALESAGASVGGALGAKFGGPVGAALGEELGRIYGEAIGGIGESTEKSLEGIGVLLGGPITGGILGKVAGKIFGDSQTAAEKARNSAQKFFGEVFEGIDLENVDLSLDDIIGGDSFRGVANAFDLLKEEGEDVAGVLGGALATVTDGSLFDLKLGIQALGLSITDMQDALVQAALAGEQSFLETQVALQGLGELAEEGVPGQIGAVGVALDKVKEAGVLGGKLTTEALKAIGAEADELGISTIPELQQALLDAGATEADVAQLAEAMNEVGVTVDDLSDAVDTELIAILADLESQGFAFAEKAGEQVDELIRRLDEIPANVESTVTVRVRTVAEDSGAQGIIDSGDLRLGGEGQ